MSDKELEKKLRWIFEVYGRDLQSFFRDAYAKATQMRHQPNLTNLPQCETIHNANKVLANCSKTTRLELPSGNNFNRVKI